MKLSIYNNFDLLSDYNKLFSTMNIKKYEEEGGQH